MGESKWGWELLHANDGAAVLGHDFDEWGEVRFLWTDDGASTAATAAITAIATTTNEAGGNAVKAAEGAANAATSGVPWPPRSALSVRKPVGRVAAIAQVRAGQMMSTTASFFHSALPAALSSGH